MKTPSEGHRHLFCRRQDLRCNLQVERHGVHCNFIISVYIALYSFSSPENMLVTAEIATACVSDKYPAVMVQSKAREEV